MGNDEERRLDYARCVVVNLNLKHAPITVNQVIGAFFMVGGGACSGCLEVCDLLHKSTCSPPE